VFLNAANNVATVQTTGPSTPSTNAGATSLPQIIEQLPELLNWAVQHLTTDDDGAYLAQAIRDGSAVAVSDGSLRGEFGTSTFIMEGPTSAHHIRAVNIVPGPLPKGDSHRCKLAGSMVSFVLRKLYANVTTSSQVLFVLHATTKRL
jgi:hypothetical protein